MPRRALIDHRPWLLASLVAATSYFFFRDNPIPGTYLILWKGAGVAFLAVYAVRRGKSVDRWLISLVLALAALGDMTLEIDLMAGGAFFAVAHLVAIALFLRNPRAHRTRSQIAASLALFIATPAIAALLAFPDPRWSVAAAYAAMAGAMASVAWLSRFPRYRVGIGAVLFVISDLVILATESGRLAEELSWWLIWPLYYTGQLLIATGIVQTLHRDRILSS